MSARTAGPSIIFVPGAWHRCAVYDTVVDKLKSSPKFADNKIIYVELPSVGAEPGDPSMWTTEPDVQAVESAIAAEVDSGKDVLVVSHSYGSIPAQDALYRFVDSGKVRQIIISGFLLEQRESLMGLGRGVAPPWHDRQGDLVYAKTPEQIFYNDLPESKQKEYAAALKASTYVCKISPQFHTAYTTIPTTYVSCKQDNAVAAQYQDLMIGRAIEKNGAKQLQVRTLDSSHSPFLSKPAEVASIIEEGLSSFAS